MKMLKNKKGFLLPMAAIFIVIMVIIGMGILYLGTLERLGAKKRLNREKAFYLAEAGAYRAYAHLRADRNWQPETEPLSLGDGTFLVEREDTEDRKINIVSTGTVKGIDEKVQLTLSSGAGNSWAQGLFGSIRIRMSNSALIAGYDSSTDPRGNVQLSNAEAGSKLLIELSNNCTIYGNASVTEAGSINLYNNSKITGQQNTDTVFDPPLDNLPDVVIPSDLAALPYPVKGDPRIKLISGQDSDWTLSGGTLNVSNNVELEISGGDYRFSNIYSSNNTIIRFTGNTRIYVENQINISNNSKWDIQGSMTIYLGTNSNFLVSNNAKIGKTQGSDIFPVLPQNLRIYSASTRSDAVSFSNNSKVAGLLYVPRGRIDMNNNGGFLGGIIANIIDLSNNAKVLYDINLNNIEIPDDPGGSGTGRVRIIRWTKPEWVNRLQ